MANSFQKQVGKNIKYIRKQKGISQENLAEIIGVSEKTISHWETGSNAITFLKLPLIAEALGVPVYKLFIPSDFHSDPSNLKNMLDSLNDKELAIAESVINLIFISR